MEQAPPPPRPLFLLLRASLPALSQHSTLIRFSGGLHAFLAMARALRVGEDADVAVLSTGPRTALLRDGAEQGWLLRPGGAPLPSPCTPGVVRVEVDGLRHHVGLVGDETGSSGLGEVDAEAARRIDEWRRRRRRRQGQQQPPLPAPAADAAKTMARLPRAQAAMLLEALALACAAPPSTRVVVVLNADGAQGPLARDGAASSAATLTEAVAAVFSGDTYAFVQNVHSLPFGPYGGAARGSDALQAAWGRRCSPAGLLPSLGGAIAVSRFVQGYLSEHGVASGLSRGVLHVTLSAWGVFGGPEWPDFGGELAAIVEAWWQQQQQQEDPPPPPPFVFACPKLTPEKGLGLVVQLARRLPDVQFVAVASSAAAADDDAATSSSWLPPPNLRLLPPSPSPDPALRGAALCLCPSLWREAYGMTAVDAALRGVPVAASAGCGGLEEAARLLLVEEEEEEQDNGDGCWPARLLPVEFVRVPADEGEEEEEDGEGAQRSPPWARREVPAEQPPAIVEAWARAVLEARDELLAADGGAVFARRSAATRARALAMVAAGHEARRRFLAEVLAE